MTRSRVWGETALGLAILALATVVNWLRLPASSRDTMYAEDGQRFIHDWLTNGIGTLVTPYDGYQHFIPRAGAALVTTLVPPDGWAYAMSIGACLVVGVVAALVWWATASLDLSMASRVGLSAIPVLSPVAGIESIANLTNVHWYFIYAMPWLLLAKARNRTTAALLFVAVLIGVVTEVQTLLWAPLAGILVLTRRSHRAGVFAWIVGAAIQTLSYVMQGRSTGAGSPPFDSVWHGALFNSFLGGVSAHVGVNRQVVAVIGWTALLAACVSMVLICWWLLRRAPGEIRLVAFLLPLVAFGSWALAHYYLNYPALNFIEGPFRLARWGTAGGMLLWALVPLAFGGLSRRWLAWAATGTLLAVMAGSFVVPNSRNGVYWGPELAKAQQACQGTPDGTAKIETTPADWWVEVPCDAILD